MALTDRMLTKLADLTSEASALLLEFECQRTEIATLMKERAHLRAVADAATAFTDINQIGWATEVIDAKRRLREALANVDVVGRTAGGYRVMAREGHPEQFGHVESPHRIACPYCGRIERLVYVELWEPVPGFASWTERGAPPYVYLLLPAIHEHVSAGCSGRVMAGRFLLLPRLPIDDDAHSMPPKESRAVSR